MGPFGAIKCAEQLRTDVGYPRLPVRFMARLSGLAMGFFGPSHQGTDDIGIARAIANLTVVSSADANAVIGLMRSTFDIAGPVLFRITENAGPVYGSPPRFEFGKWVPVRAGGDLTIIATGGAVAISVGAAERLADQGVAATVLDAAFLKPVDIDAVVDAAARGPIVTVEEHMPIGGLGSIVCEILGERGIAAGIDRIAIRDEAIEAGVPAALLEYYGLTPQAVAERALALVRAAHP
jgi:transketolase